MEEAPDRMPQISNTFTWKILDEGYTLSEAMYDYEKMEKVVRGHQERYGFDLVRDVGTRNGFKMIEGWAEPRYVIDDEAGRLNVKDMELMKEDEYGELVEDRRKFFWTKVFPRRFPELTHSTPQQIF